MGLKILAGGLGDRGVECFPSMHRALGLSARDSKLLEGSSVHFTQWQGRLSAVVLWSLFPVTVRSTLRFEK